MEKTRRLSICSSSKRLCQRLYPRWPWANIQEE